MAFYIETQDSYTIVSSFSTGNHIYSTAVSSSHADFRELTRLCRYDRLTATENRTGNDGLYA